MPNVIFQLQNTTSSLVTNRKVTLTPYTTPKGYGKQTSLGGQFSKNTGDDGRATFTVIPNVYKATIDNCTPFYINVPSSSVDLFASELVISGSVMSSGSSTVWFDLIYGDISDIAETTVTLVPYVATDNPPSVVSQSIIVQDPYKFTTDSTGDFTASMVQPGTYTVYLNGIAPYFIQVPTGSGEHYAEDLRVTIGTSTTQQLPQSTVYYSFYTKEQVDGKIAAHTGSAISASHAHNADNALSASYVSSTNIDGVVTSASYASNANYAESANAANSAFIAVSANTAASATSATSASVALDVSKAGTLRIESTGGGVFDVNIKATDTIGIGAGSVNIEGGYGGSGGNINLYPRGAGSVNLKDVNNTTRLSVTATGINVTGGITGSLSGHATAATNADYANEAGLVEGGNVIGSVTRAVDADSADAVNGSNVIGIVASASYFSGSTGFTKTLNFGGSGASSPGVVNGYNNPSGQYYESLQICPGGNGQTIAFKLPTYDTTMASFVAFRQTAPSSGVQRIFQFTNYGNSTEYFIWGLDSSAQPVFALPNNRKFRFIRQNSGDFDILTIDSSNQRVSVGNFTSPSAKLHIIATTEQLRTGYDTSNYLSTTVSSVGAVTFDSVGTSPSFTFSDKVNCNSQLSASAITASAFVTDGGQSGITKDVYYTDASGNPQTMSFVNGLLVSDTQ